MVPRTGVEPAHLAAREPKSRVSTNSTIWAFLVGEEYVIVILDVLQALSDTKCSFFPELDYSLKLPGSLRKA